MKVFLNQNYFVMPNWNKTNNLKYEILKFRQIGHFGLRAVLNGHCGTGLQHNPAKLSTATLKSHHFVNLTDSRHSPPVETWTICWFDQSFQSLDCKCNSRIVLSRNLKISLLLLCSDCLKEYKIRLKQGGLHQNLRWIKAQKCDIEQRSKGYIWTSKPSLTNIKGGFENDDKFERENAHWWKVSFER